ncbi:MAG: type II toxin-antitoxin system VapC family toxin [Polyangiaceae bacterium]|nr:type II toxin-antitoxin system VapC family toxin [Polyangiaceae bacterium]
MNVLLDTHAFVWWDNAKLPKRVVSRIRSAGDVYVSAATAWEIAIKSALGRISVKGDMTEALADYGFLELPISIAHADAVRSLPPIHRDPFDRILVAQASTEDLVIVSNDELMREYPVRVVWD